MKSPSSSDSEKDLLFNVQSGSITGVEHSLKRGVNINAHNNMISGDTALHFAVMGHFYNQYADDKCPYLKIAKMLLKNGADVNFPNYHGVTPLQLALLRGKIKMVQLLLNKGSEINKILRGIHRDFDLHHQTRSIVDFLLRNKTFRVSSRDYPILLQFALRHGDEKTFEMILKKKVEFDINTILPTMNYAIIHLVVQNGTVKMIKDLIDHGVDIERKDIHGDTPIHEAIKKQKIDHFIYLLNCGASVFCENFQGRTALHTAAEYKAEETIVNLILNKGISINIRSQVDGKTPLHVACSKLDNLEIVKFLVKNGANFDSKDRYGETPLHTAMHSYVKAELVEYLLELKANVNIQDVNGDTALSTVLHLSYVIDRKLEILVAHLARMIACKSDVCAKNLEMIEHRVVNDYYKICDTELCQMKEKICSSSTVSYLDLLTKNVQNFSAFIWNEEIMTVLNSRSYLNKFHIYGDFLERKINKAKSRALLMQKVTEIFYCQLKIKLPHVVLNQLFSYMNELELSCFVETFL